MLFLLLALLHCGTSKAGRGCAQGKMLLSHASHDPPLSLCLSPQIDICCCDYVFSSLWCTPYSPGRSLRWKPESPFRSVS